MFKAIVASAFLIPVSCTVPVSANADVSVSIVWQDVKQEIDGFGASSAWYAAAIRRFPAKEREELLDDLFSTTKGAGLSLLRNRIPPDIHPSPELWSWDRDQDTVWLMEEAKKRGADKIWSSPWTPPAWMKTNKDLNNGGSLKPEHYQDYADYLTQYIVQYKLKHSIELYGISIQNEPAASTAYESCVWTGEQLHTFLKEALIPAFRKQGITTKIIMPEHENWSERLAEETLNDPETAAAVDIVAAHRYGAAGKANPFPNALSKDKKVWETEVSELKDNDPSIIDGLRWAIDIHETLVNGKTSAWHYWWLYHDRTNGQSLIIGDKDSKAFKTMKRLWTLGSFSRFVRPGYHMIGMSSNRPDLGIFTSAYQDPQTRKFVIVAINNTKKPFELHVDLNTMNAEQVTPYRTSETEDITALEPIQVSKKQFAAALAAQSVTTYTGEPKGPLLSRRSYAAIAALSVIVLAVIGWLAWRKRRLL